MRNIIFLVLIISLNYNCLAQVLLNKQKSDEPAQTIDPTILQISHQSGYSPRTLQSYFDLYLSKRPVLHIKPSEKINLLIDGNYFTNKLRLVLYRDNHIKFTQLYRITDGEWVVCTQGWK